MMRPFSARIELKPNIPGIKCCVRVLVATVLLICTQNGRAGEPESNGRPLSYWLEQYVTNNAAGKKLAEAAIRDIGTNSLPALVVWLRYEPSQTKTDVMEFLKRMRRTAYGRWIPPELTYDRGAPRGDIGFSILGPTAAPAIPELAEIANDAKHSRPAARAMMALSFIGPAALPAVEARLANTNFPFPPDAALNMYMRTRISTNYRRFNTAEAKLTLVELQTNTTPTLAQGATQLLELMEQPSSRERGQTKDFSEALDDLRTQRRMGVGFRPDWNVPAEAKWSVEEQRAASNAVRLALTSPPALPKDDEPYPYPLLPGSHAWDRATVEERIKSIEIPKSWLEHATSWQIFRSAIANPYFRGISLGSMEGSDIGTSYQASRSGLSSLLQQVDISPDFGTNVLRWLSSIDFPKMLESHCDKPETCWMDYETVCYMASMDSALNTLDVASRQRLYRLAIWDADYLLSRGETLVAGAPIGLICAIAREPESFRGVMPPGALVLPPTLGSTTTLALSQGLTFDPPTLQDAVAEAKVALGLKQRP